MSTKPSKTRLNRRTRQEASVELCEQHIIEGIQSGRYLPSKRLGEASVAKEMGVGQSYVRGAFARLTQLGLLDRKHRAGTYVRELSIQELVEMTQVRALLEGFACRLVCQYATNQDLAELETIGRKLDQRLARLVPETYRAVEREDLEFHEKLVRMSGSSVLIQMLSEKHLILTCLRRGFDLPSAFAGNDSRAPSHAEIVQTLRSREPNEADRCMRRHLMSCLKSDLRLDGVIEV